MDKGQSSLVSTKILRALQLKQFDMSIVYIWNCNGINVQTEAQSTEVAAYSPFKKKDPMAINAPTGEASADGVTLKLIALVNW
jgi:hypothetical protein